MAQLFSLRRGTAEDAASERHARSTVLADFILGSQDGLVNVLGVILGVAVASWNFRIILAGGLAATFAESISMGAVAYTTTLARLDHYRSELERERQEMRDLPESERQEVRTILTSWGFAGAELEEMLDRIVSKERAWLEIMMAHELKIAPIEEEQPVRSALLVFAAAVAGSLLPLIPFIVAGDDILAGILASVFASAIILFVIGWYKGRLTIGRPTRSGLQMLVIGIASAIAGFAAAYLVNRFFGV